MLIARGVTAWQRLLAGITSATTTATAATDTIRTPPVPTRTPPPPHEPVSPTAATQPTRRLIHLLADLAVTLAGA